MLLCIRPSKYVKSQLLERWWWWMMIIISAYRTKVMIPKTFLRGPLWNIFCACFHFIFTIGDYGQQQREPWMMAIKSITWRLLLVWLKLRTYAHKFYWLRKWIMYFLYCRFRYSYPRSIWCHSKWFSSVDVQSNNHSHAHFHLLTAQSLGTCYRPSGNYEENIDSTGWLLEKIVQQSYAMLFLKAICDKFVSYFFLKYLLQ